MLDFNFYANVVYVNFTGSSPVIKTFEICLSAFYKRRWRVFI